jgi:hypothetical protein
MAERKKPVKNPSGRGVPPAAPSKGVTPELQTLWEEARLLESQLEKELLEDAVKSARMAIDELHAETKTQPFERRRGLRLREKSERVERAFNRLRALRKGDMLPERHPDD